MGTATRAAPALRLSSHRAEPAGGGGAAEHEGSGGGVAVEDRARHGHRADLPAGAAGQAAEAAGPRAGCGAGVGQRARVDRGELGGGKAQSKAMSVKKSTFRWSLGAEGL